jgi:hypothetical protein
MSIICSHLSFIPAGWCIWTWYEGHATRDNHIVIFWTHHLQWYENGNHFLVEQNPEVLWLLDLWKMSLLSQNAQGHPVNQFQHNKSTECHLSTVTDINKITNFL